jgi:hypothetical protein
MSHLIRQSLLPATLTIACATAAASSPPFQPTFHLSDFSHPLRIDNPWSPFQTGTRYVFHELEDGECKTNDVVVTEQSKHDFHGIYAGLAARSVIDRVWSDPSCEGKRALLLEDTVDWYAQDDRGNVWYVGERTVEYAYDDAGHRISSDTAGSWEAGRDGARAGYAMPAAPFAGFAYRQEFLAGEAEDEARVVDVGIRAWTKLGRFHDCVRTRDTTALSPGDVEFKTYCRNLGLVRVVAPAVSGGAELVTLSRSF